MKTKLMLAALLASAAFAQATPAITPAKSRATQSDNGRAVFHVVGQKNANGPFLNHPETAPGPH